MSFARDFIRRFPVTAAMIAVAVAMQLAVWLYPAVGSSNSGQARRALGAVTQLGLYPEAEPNQPRTPIPQLFGPFDLWQGELWRVPVSGFHHVNLGHPANPLHLMMNCLAIAFMGAILEPRMGHWTYAAFFLTATTISVAVELLLSNYVMGLSGGGYAMFGCLAVLRSREPAIADRLPPGFVQAFMIWLFLCMALTLFNVVNIGNAAHVSGLIYGWLFGLAYYTGPPAAGWKKAVFLAAHLLLVPAAYFLMHPFWLGTYHWYLAQESDDDRQKIAEWQQAVSWDPSLRLPWNLLARHYLKTGDNQRAWDIMLRGLDYNRADDRGVKLARLIWLSFRTPDERWQALQRLDAVFEEGLTDWKYRLGILPNQRPPNSLPIALDVGLPQPDAYRPRSDAEKEMVQLLSAPDRKRHDLTAPPVQPDAAGSAAEGVTL